MSALHVLRDVAMEWGLGQAPARDLALWAAAAPGELGALGREASAMLPSRPPLRRVSWAGAWSLASSRSKIEPEFSERPSPSSVFCSGSGHKRYSLARSRFGVSFESVSCSKSNGGDIPF